jgi:quinol monooxygenase YgiN
MRYGIYTRHTAKPGQREALVANLLRAGELLKDSPACVQWVVSEAEQPDAVWVSAIWSSKDDHDKAMQPDVMAAAMRELMVEARQLLSEEVTPEQIFVTPVGGKGL